MSYCTSASCYLDRARIQLDTGGVAGLFYAALELRLGVEVRLREYLEAHPSAKTKKARSHYKVARMGAQLNKVFKGDRAARIIFEAPGLTEPLVLFYTPVTKALRKNVGRLGDYLHSPKAEPTEEYFFSFRQLLEEVYTEFKLAAAGTLMGPPLGEVGTKSMRMTWQLPARVSQHLKDAVLHVGAPARIDVRYFDEMSEAEVDAALRMAYEQ